MGKHLETHETRRVRKDGTELDVSLTISPIGSDSGRLYGASVIARDITSERRRRRAREFLIAATRDLDASLDPVETARNIVAKAVPELAEVCVIDFIRPDGRIGDSVAASAIPGAAERLERIRRDSPLDPEGDHPVAQVLRADEPMIWGDLKAARRGRRGRPERGAPGADGRHRLRVGGRGRAGRPRAEDRRGLLPPRQGRTSATSRTTSSSSASSASAPRWRWTTRGSTRSATRSPATCSAACARRGRRRSRGWSPRSSSRRPGGGSRSAATSTTCCRPRTAAGC